MSDPLSNLSVADRALFESFGQGSSSLIPFRTVHDAFLHYVHATPHAPAIYDLSTAYPEQVSYHDLWRYASFIAVHLRRQGVEPGSRIPLVVERSVAMVAGILGILMCGAQYVLLDGSVVPDQTLYHVIDESASATVLCLRAFENHINELGRQIEPIALEDLLEQAHESWSDVDSMQSPHAGDENSGCFIVYTSGTTGAAKGVDVTHRNVTNILCQAPGNLGLTTGSRVASILSISFDMGAWEILGSLCNGATLVLRGSNWKAALREVDTLICTPSIMGQYDPAEFPNIKCVATAGEPCPQSLADKWALNVRFYNCCGPAEVTIINTIHAHIPGQPLSIGKPTPNNNVYILDGNQAPVPIGQPGVMWGGGAGITRGYVNLPDKTAERYRLDRFAKDGSMMYNTGDLGRWLPDGSIEMLGRSDDQVKIKGFRLELDGLSASMRSCPGVLEAIALLIEGELTGFVAPQSCNTGNVAAHMSALLPYYAIPTHWHTLDTLPLTSNGKTDKRALASLTSKDSKSVSKDTTIMIKEAPSTQQSSTETLPIILSNGPVSVDLQEHTEKQAIPLPGKKLSKPSRGLRYRIFIIYRRLFSIVWLLNILALVCVLAIPSIDRQWLSIVSFMNLTVAILVRQDTVINTMYTICCSVPTSWPLAIRLRFAKIYHFGGVHSGAASAAVCWYIGNLGYNVKCAVNGCSLPGKPSVATLVLSFLIMTLLLAIVILAYPPFRKKNHNLFERVHRFAGWTAVAIIWVQTMLTIRDQRHASQSLGNAVVRSPNFWMLVIITLSIASSWFYLKKVPVDAEVLSNHAIRLHFDYTVPINGAFARISERPLLEWHSFATIAAPTVKNGRKIGYSLVVSRAGDWTSRQISKPPTVLWKRGLPTYGVMRITTLFRSLVLVGTGSGIGPLLGHLQIPPCRFRLVWSTPSPLTTFGPEIMDEVCRADPGAIIHDTRKLGRPDMVQLAWDAFCEFGAEAVVIISNEKITKKVVYGMESRGVPAFGAIWDS